MANDTATSTATETAKSAKVKASERVWLDANGGETEDVNDVRGFKYTSLADKYDAVVMFDGENKVPDHITFALAAFGGLTLAGNYTNTVRNNKQKPAQPGDEQAALESWMEMLRAGDWTKPSGEGEAGMATFAEAFARHLDETKAKPDGSKRAASPEGIAKVREYLTGLDKDKKKEFRNDMRVAAHIKAIQAERAAARVAAAPQSTLETPDDL